MLFHFQILPKVKFIFKKRHRLELIQNPPIPLIFSPSCKSRRKAAAGHKGPRSPGRRPGAARRAAPGPAANSLSGSFSVQLQDQGQLLPVQDPTGKSQGQGTANFLLISHTSP